MEFEHAVRIPRTLRKVLKNRAKKGKNPIDLPLAPLFPTPQKHGFWSVGKSGANGRSTRNFRLAIRRQTF
jgi:hypothetical protein